jgi:transcriptional regulator with XRE-family HTH domain
MAAVERSQIGVERSQIGMDAQMEGRRRRLGISRPVLARRSGVSLPTVNRILGGGCEHATYASLKAVAQALGMDFALKSTVDELDLAEQQARAKAEVIARMVQGTSALESQAVDPETYRQIVAQTVHVLMAGSRRKLWSPG